MAQTDEPGRVDRAAAGEEVVSASEYRALEAQVRELQRLLGKKAWRTNCSVRPCPGQHNSLTTMVLLLTYDDSQLERQAVDADDSATDDDRCPLFDVGFGRVAHQPWWERDRHALAVERYPIRSFARCFSASR